MKILKVLSASAVATAMLASMAMTANAEAVSLEDDADALDLGAAIGSLADDELNDGADFDKIVDKADDQGVEALTDDENDAIATDLNLFGNETETPAEVDTKTDATKTDDKTTDADCLPVFDSDDWGWGWSFGKNAKVDLLDVVDAAREAGVNAVNVQTLRNFLILNDEYFDGDDYADMIAALKQIKTLYIDDKALKAFGKAPKDLTENERIAVYNLLSKAEKDAIQVKAIKVANEHGILLTWDTDENGYPVVYGSMRGHYDSGTKASSSNTQVNAGSAVKATGDVPETASTGAAAFAGVALALAAAGVVVVARKNRA